MHATVSASRASASRASASGEKAASTKASAPARAETLGAGTRHEVAGAAGRLWAFGTTRGLAVQRACACGGTCDKCRGEDEELRIQRKADDAAASPEMADPAATTTAPAVLVEDGETAAAGQMTRAAFVAAMRAELLPMCDDELAPAGRTADGCPYLTYWLTAAGAVSGTQLERGIRRFTHTSADTAAGLLEAVVSRVRAAVRLWVATGQIATPKALGPIDPSAGAGVQIASLLGLLGTDLPAPPPEPGAVQTKADGAGAAPAAPRHSPSAVRAQLGAGHALDGAVRARMEQGFGQSFAGVRVHTDTTASGLATGLSARAFTVGQDIAFRSDQYRPGSLAGDLLIAHELAHTVQQRDATGEVALPMHHDRRLEDDADRAAVGAVGSALGVTERSGPAGRTGLSLQGCQEVKYRCPPHYSWRVERTMGWGSAGCTCFWKCLPGEPPRKAQSRQAEFRCPPEMNCSTGIQWEELGDDYEKSGYGAALTPLGEAPYCGCFPLTIDGEQISDSPLRRSDFELTDIAGPVVDIAAARKGGKPQTDTTTGTRLPDKRPSAPQVVGPGAKPTPTTGPLKTTPMMGRYAGEHRPNNTVWRGSQVKYLTDSERTSYQLTFKDGKIYDVDGNLFDTSSARSAHSGGGSAIFIMDGAGNFFASKVQKVGEFHHSSLASGKPVAAAGELQVEKGVLKGITDQSGHYQPTTDLTAQAIQVLEGKGIDMSAVTRKIIGKPPAP